LRAFACKRIAALLAEHRASAELARKLVSIDTAAPVEADVTALDCPVSTSARSRIAP